jgi:hypothetical protein
LVKLAYYFILVFYVILSDFLQVTKFYWHVLWHAEEFREKKLKEMACQWAECTIKFSKISKVEMTMTKL